MRKKLLALLMCATMVLGTGVTAMASTADDAKKIYVNKSGNNANLFMDEFYKGNETIVRKVYNPNAGDFVEYGYLNDADPAAGDYDYTPVVVYKDGTYKEATYVSGTVYKYEQLAAINATDIKEIWENDADAAKAAADKIPGLLDAAFGAQAAQTLYTVKDGNVMLYDKDKKTFKATDLKTLVPADASNPVTYKLFNKDGKAVDQATLTITAGAAAATFTAGAAADTDAQVISATTAASGESKAVKVYAAAGGSNIYLSQDHVNKGVTSFVTGSKDAYVKYDNGGALVAGSTKLFKAANEDTVVYTNMSTVFADDATDGTLTGALTYALDKEVITKDAVLVKMNNYVLINQPSVDLKLAAKANTLPAKACPLYNGTRITSGTFTLDADLLSRTGLASAAAVDVYKVNTLFPTAYDFDYGFVNELTKVATAEVGGAFTFENAASFTDGYFLFDKGTVEEKPSTDANDGVSDATTPAATTDTTTSPKTGDVAPIAALAVVMMGAFGAMVVASKKRV